MSDCPASLGWPADPTAPCDHNGTCFFGQCVCSDGWLGQGDFVLGSNSCDINIDAIRVLWSITAFANGIAMLCSIYFTFAVLFAKSGGKVKALSARRQKQFFVATCFTSSSSLLVVSLMRVISPATSAIGANVATTLLFALGSLGFWLAGVQFVNLFLQVAIAQAKMHAGSHLTSTMLTSLRTAIFVIIGLVFSAQMAVVAMLGATSVTAVYALGVAHYCLLGLVHVFLGAWLVPHFLGVLITDIESVLSADLQGSRGNNSQLRILLAKVKTYHVQLRNQLFFNLPVCFTVGCWPWLQAKSSYWLPIAYLSTSFLIVLALYLEFPVSRDKSAAVGSNTGEIQPASSATSSAPGPHGQVMASAHALLNEQKSSGNVE